MSLSKSITEYLLTSVKKSRWEKRFKQVMKCYSSKCGKEILAGETVVAKKGRNHTGKRTKHYHELCWNALFTYLS